MPCRGDHLLVVLSGSRPSDVVRRCLPPGDADVRPTVSGIAPRTSLIIRRPATAGPPAPRHQSTTPRTPRKDRVRLRTARQKTHSGSSAAREKEEDALSAAPARPRRRPANPAPAPMGGAVTPIRPLFIAAPRASSRPTSGGRQAVRPFRPDARRPLFAARILCTRARRGPVPALAPGSPTPSPLTPDASIRVVHGPMPGATPWGADRPLTGPRPMTRRAALRHRSSAPGPPATVPVGHRAHRPRGPPATGPVGHRAPPAPRAPPKLVPPRPTPGPADPRPASAYAPAPPSAGAGSRSNSPSRAPSTKARHSASV